MSENRVRVDLDDRVFGISGTIDPDDYKEPATGVSEKHDLVYVKYTPAMKTKEAIKAKVSSFLSFLPTVKGLSKRRIPEPVPEEQVDLVYTPNFTGKDSDQDLAGQPDRKLVIRQFADGDAPYDDRVQEREENKISQIEAERSRAQSDALTSEAEAIDLESEDDEEEKNRNRIRPENREVMH